MPYRFLPEDHSLQSALRRIAASASLTIAENVTSVAATADIIRTEKIRRMAGPIMPASRPDFPTAFRSG